MNTKSTMTMNSKSDLFNVISWLFGIGVIAVGLVNSFWGNDPGFGVFLILLALVYLPPVNNLIREKTGVVIHPILKIVLGSFIIWAALGVGELFDKIDLMMTDLS